MIRASVVTCFLFFLVGCGAGTGGRNPDGPKLRSSGVGNGGDVVDRFLEATRFALKETLFLIRSGRDKDSLCRCVSPRPDAICQSLEALTGEQRGFCREFILRHVDDYVTRNTGEHRVPFEVTSDPLVVSDPKGHLRPVDAMTPAAAIGAIRFNYDHVKNYPPALMLALVGHELGHKVEERGQFLQDNDAIGPFRQPEGGGRELLDAVGAALADYATRQGKIERFFGLDDFFTCRIRVGAHGPVVSPARVKGLRLFLGEGFDRYESGMGERPRNRSCSLVESDGQSEVSLVVKIHEEKGCEAGASPAERWTSLELWRFYYPKLGAPTPNAERIEARRLDGWNPLCAKGAPETMALEYRSRDGIRVDFSSRYDGSEGHTADRVPRR